MKLHHLILVIAACTVACVSMAEEIHAPFRVTTIVLSHPDEVLQARLMDQQVFTAYIQALRNAIQDYGRVLPAGTGRAGGVIVAVKPGAKVRFWIDAPLDAEQTQGLLSALRQVSVPAVQHGPVVFGFHVDFWQGAGDATHQEPGLPFTPSEWKEAASKAGKPVLIDDIITMVWPE